MTLPAQAQVGPNPGGPAVVNQFYRYAAGSCFGRAVPVPVQTLCVPGTAGCAVPAEIVMVFTLNADGTFIGIDSNIFAGGRHSMAHGQWTKRIKKAATGSPVAAFDLPDFQTAVTSTTAEQCR